MAAPSFKKLQSATYGKIANQQHVPLQDLVKPHIESFNYVLKEGLSVATRNIHPMEFEIGDGERVSFSYRDATIGRPTVARSNRYAATLKVFPSECRQRGTTYRAKLQAAVVWKTSKGRQGVKDMVIGEVPIMVKSDNCNLNTLTPSQLIRHGEEAEEMGGYFIVNGIERVIRMLVMSRRNYPMAISRPKWKTRGQAFTELGVTMRCVKDDQTSTNLVLHYMNNGNIILSFTCRKETFFIALATVLKALVDTTDQHIYNELLKGKEDDTFLIGCVTEMLRQAQAKDLTTQHSIVTFIGEQFRVKLGVPDWYTPEEVAKVLISQHICIHLDSNIDKFNALILMARKLFSFARGQCSADNADSPMNQEVLLAGHLYQMVLKEKMEHWLLILKLNLLKKVSSSSTSNFIVSNVNLTPIFQACKDLTRPMEYLLATGNVVSKTGLGLMQSSGVTVVADKLNFMRFVSHFRCVHRGSFFSEMRTTSVRKLLPEAWGFLCPVHTPDGAPCGLMNHLTATCQITNSQPIMTHFPRFLCSLGMAPLDGPAPGPVEDCYEVVLDGRVLGMVHKDLATELDVKLRTLKATEDKEVPSTLEVVLIPMTKHASQYPGLFLFTTPARFMRPVLNLATQSTQLIGSLEQVYLNIAVTTEEIHPGKTSHMELSESSILSVAASLTPFSDFNQSPRNMYQCQMGKQTMGVSSHTLKFRNDHKMYHLQTPQSPIVRPLAYDHYNFDEYPLGTNAIVAVISYTGYDMEDAMILNKSSVERGFCHGTIYKTEQIDLRKKCGGLKKTQIIFGCDVTDSKAQGKLDSDGFPPVGSVIQPGDPFYGYQDLETKTYKIERYTGMETGIVDNVKITGEEVGNQEGQKAYIQLRIQRNPIIGDKFSSRHGQKGICSQRWPAENMPFTESGMTPDIIFNPHGFPSRMTIGMMIESMAGKSGSLHGLCHDATPFTFSEDQPAVDYFGRLLKAAGYNYYGTEIMYSGVTGVELEAEIFFGVVYYQRLRHMVSDKFQVRSTGPIDVVTHQPIKGRKRAGGIRFGEMERDSLLAHGTSFLLQDRLLNCSDKSMSHICTKCGTILGINLDKQSADQDAEGISSALFGSSQKWTCGTCMSADNIDVITIPYVFQYLVAELSAMNIKVKLDVK